MSNTKHRLLDRRRRADLAMLAITVFWGMTFPLIRRAMSDLDPPRFVAARFVLATLAFLPLVLAQRGARGGLRAALLPGIGLGFLAWASYFSQTIGLQTVAAGRAAFITGMSVVLVPLMSPAFRAGRPSRVELLAATVALFGLYLLCDPTGSGISGGDAWILLCATLYAAYIHTLQIVLRRGPVATSLAFTQVLGVMCFALLALPLSDGEPVAWSRAALVSIVLCALLATVGTFWLQTRYQSHTTPQRVALIFAMEPVFATLFAFAILGEMLAPLGQLGAAIILLAVIAVELWELRAKRNEAVAANEARPV